MQKYTLSRMGFLALLLLALTASTPWAATYYVATTGDDLRNCTTATNIATPKQTPGNALACLSAGDTLYLRAGRYPTITTDTAPLPSGTSWTNATTIAGYPGELVELTYVIMSSGANKSYIILNNLTFSPSANGNDVGLYMGTGNHHIRLSNSIVRDSLCLNGAGMISGSVNDFELLNSRVSGAGGNNGAGCVGEQGCYGLYMNGANGLYDGNQVYQNGGWGFNIYASGGSSVSNNIVRNNIVWGNGFTDPRSLAGDGILVSSGDNNLVYNNLVYGNATGIAVGYNATNHKIYNNTVYNNTGDGIVILPSGSNSTVRNNITYGNGNNLVDWKTPPETILSNNLIGTNPLFVNAGAGDFHLSSGSPAIGYATNLSGVFTTDIVGSVRAASGPWDAGAYTSGTSTPQPAAQVAFSTQPQTTPAGTAMPTITAQLQNGLGALIPGASGTVTLSLAGILIPQTQLSVVSVDSEEAPTYQKAYALDGNLSTFWHTEFIAAAPSHPHTMVVNLGGSYSVAGLTYRPRTDGDVTGDIVQYTISVSTDGSTWGTAVASGAFTLDTALHGLTWTPKTGSYLRIVAQSEAGGGPYTNINELNVLKATAVTLSGTLSQATSGGVATFTGISMPTPDTGYVMQAAAAGLITGLSAPFSMATSGTTPTKLAFSAQPVSTQVNTTIPTVTVLIQDVNGATVTSSSATVTLVEQSVGATVNGTLSRAAVNGVATFPGLSMPTVGTGYYFRATSPGLTLANSATFAITAPAAVAQQLTWSTQPTTTDVDATMDAVTVRIENLTGTLDTGATASVTVGIAGILIPQTQFSVVSVDSEESGYEKANAIDGNTATFWHTEFSGAQPPHPHEIVLNLGGSYAVVGLTYQPRDDAEPSGTIIQYRVYVSTDGSTWGTAVKEGSFTKEIKTHGITWPQKTGAYLKLEALSEWYEAGPYTNVNELNVLAVAPVTVNGTTTVAASAGVATFSTLALGTPGVGYVFSAAAAGLLTGLSAPFTINDTIPTQQLTWSTQPTTADADVTMNAMTVRIEDLTGALDTGATASVTVGIAGILIPQTQLSVVSVDSEESGYAKEYAIDGNTGTFWHTEYVNAQPPHPHEIVLNLGGSYNVVGLTYQPRDDAQTGGNIIQYRVYVSTDGSTWGAPVKEGSLTEEVKTHGITWPQKTGTYLKLEALSEWYPTDPYTNVNELNVLASSAIAVSGTTTVAASGGIATFSTLTIGTPGVGYVLSATAGGRLRGLSTPVTITAGGLPTLQAQVTTQPQQTPEDTTLAPVVVQIQNLTGTLQTGATTSITLALAGRLLPQTQLSVVSVDSEEAPTYQKAYAIDGNTATFWHTEWLAATPPHPHEIVLNLGGSYAVAGLTYQPRVDAYTVGNILQYRVYVSTDGSTWGVPVKEGSFTQEVKTHGITWTPKTGTYLKLEALNEWTSDPYTTVNELNVLVTTTVTLGGTTVVAASGGIATFSALSVPTAGDRYVLRASGAALLAGLSAPFTATLLPTQLVFGTQPVSAQAGATLPLFTVEVRNADGLLVPQATNTVTIAEQTIGATISGTLSRAAVNGVATFTGLSIATPLTAARFRATASGLTLADSATFNIQALSGAGTLLPARALHLVP